MVLWQWINDNLPLYAEQITVNEEVERIERTLNKFDQLVPEGFTELGQPKKYWGSTEGLDKPLCERYTFKYDNKSYTLDISQELSNKLELNLKDNFCAKEEVLSRLPEEGGITLNDEEEIFLQKPFTVENLEGDLNKLFEKIEELEEEKKNQTKIITQKDTEITNLTTQTIQLKTEKEEVIKESAKLGGSWKSFVDWLSVNWGVGNRYSHKWGTIRSDLQYLNNIPEANQQLQWYLSVFFTRLPSSLYGVELMVYDDNKSFDELFQVSNTTNPKLFFNSSFGGWVNGVYKTRIQGIIDNCRIVFNTWRNESFIYQNKNLRNQVNDLQAKLDLLGRRN